jgi:hypothetical protein
MDVSSGWGRKISFCGRIQRAEDEENLYGCDYWVFAEIRVFTQPSPLKNHPYAKKI